MAVIVAVGRGVRVFVGGGVKVGVDVGVDMAVDVGVGVQVRVGAGGAKSGDAHDVINIATITKHGKSILDI